MSVIRPTVSSVVRPVVRPDAAGLPWESGGGGAPRRMAALTGWNGSARYEESNAGPVGSTTMSRLVVVRPDASAAGGTNVITERAAGTTGWRIQISTANVFQGQIRDGVQASILTPSYTIQAGDLTKVFTFFITFDNTTLRLFHAVGGTVTEVGTGTAATGFTVAGGTADFCIGNNVGGTAPCDDTAVCIIAGTDTDVWDTTEMQTIVNEIRATYTLATATPNELFRYRASAVLPPAAWDGDAGTDLAVQGADTALIARAAFAPTFA